MGLALFDLDNTLLAGDSDYEWGCFLAATGAVDGAWYERENHRFYQEYKEGRLDIMAFLRFVLAPLAAHERPQLEAWHARFMAERIHPIILPKARQLIHRHRDLGHHTLIITATNRFVTGPIARELGVDHLIATEPEEVAGRFTGLPAGIPCFQEGKVTRLASWLADHQLDLAESWFYSDSHNDLPLLNRVTHPVAVDPDPILLDHANHLGWPVVSLR